MALPHPVITEADVHAIRALIAGTATPDQQRIGMRWIAEQVCRVYDSPYVANGSDRDTFVMLGRHQVGTMISAMQNPSVLGAARAYDASLVKARGK